MDPVFFLKLVTLFMALRWSRSLNEYKFDCILFVMGLKIRVPDPVFGQKTGSGALYLEKRKIFKILFNKYLDNYKTLLF